MFQSIFTYLKSIFLIKKTCLTIPIQNQIIVKKLSQAEHVQGICSLTFIH